MPLDCIEVLVFLPTELIFMLGGTVMIVGKELLGSVML